MLSSKKIFAILARIIGIVIIAFVAVWYLEGQTSSGWQTYTNTAYRFSFSYPDTLNIASNPVLQSDPNYIISLIPAASTYTATSTPQYVINIRAVAPATTGTELQNILINDAVYDASGATSTSFAAFTPEKFSNHTFYFIQTGLFEGELSLHYYTATPMEIISFDLTSYGVDWTNPAFQASNDQGNLALEQILPRVSF